MQIRIIKAGIHTTLQDLGRSHYLAQAVPVSGALDNLSARMANLAIGNQQGNAVLEFTYGNAQFIADTDLLLAYAGSGATYTVSGQTLPAGRAIYIPTGTIVNLDTQHEGVRSYLAVAGGWDVPEIMGSRSTYLAAAFGGCQGRLIKKDDLLTNCNNLNATTLKIFDYLQGDVLKYTLWGIPSRFVKHAATNTVRIVAGREMNWFEPNSVINLLVNSFKVDLRSNRMGILLKGTAMQRKVTEELLSTAVCPGTIQVTGNGEMILLMADCQTTGGYPRIAQVAMIDIPLCAQLKPHDQINFSLISAIEAEQLYLKQEAAIHRLAQAIPTKING